ncbi:MAG TPA: MFS transporter [Vicinamibacterales bacterium]|nr:MFS transporter [Vicinamibacterales bacterium]
MSLATDAAGESIYPLLPVFLTQVLAAGAVSLGIVEGAAEAANSILKIVSGRMADRAPSKRGLVLAGYSLSSAIRPFIAIARTWGHVFTVRLFDRIGKGVRGAPRDAMLAAAATPTTRGKVFGFHQAMDNAGAIIGPTLATIFLIFFPGQYRTLFALTIIPGAIAVALVFLIKEEPAPEPTAHRPPPVSSPTANRLPTNLRRFLIVLSVFSLGNSADAFLLLRLTNAAGSATYVPLMWAGIHVVKTSVSLVGGAWSDRIGRRAVITTGWIVYAAVYAGFALSSSLVALLAWFLVYGFYFGFAEGTEKALVADLAPAGKRGTAFGYYNGVLGIGQLAASILFGVIWSVFGAAAAFGTGAALALAATALLFVTI